MEDKHPDSLIKVGWEITIAAHSITATVSDGYWQKAATYPRRADGRTFIQQAIDDIAEAIRTHLPVMVERHLGGDEG